MPPGAPQVADREIIAKPQLAVKKWSPARRMSGPAAGMSCVFA